MLTAQIFKSCSEIQEFLDSEKKKKGVELGLDSFDLFYTSVPKLEEFHPGFCWWHSLDTALH